MALCGMPKSGSRSIRPMSSSVPGCAEDAVGGLLSCGKVVDEHRRCAAVAPVLAGRAVRAVGAGAAVGASGGPAGAAGAAPSPAPAAGRLGPHDDPMLEPRRNRDEDVGGDAAMPAAAAGAAVAAVAPVAATPRRELTVHRAPARGPV